MFSSRGSLFLSGWWIMMPPGCTSRLFSPLATTPPSPLPRSLISLLHPRMTSWMPRTSTIPSSSDSLLYIISRARAAGLRLLVTSRESPTRGCGPQDGLFPTVWRYTIDTCLAPCRVGSYTVMTRTSTYLTHRTTAHAADFDLKLRHAPLRAVA
ncbi:hypothetical protein C8T65DRAFT_140688 [Cerioporus squamosus]|nr:hypothetical protein C8T65DRAFT_140688 [Cerioporus squamosus]